MSDSITVDPVTPAKSPTTPLFDIVGEVHYAIEYNILCIGNSLSSPNEAPVYHERPEDHFVNQLAAMTGWKVQAFASGGMSTRALMNAAQQINAFFDANAKHNWLFLWEAFKAINDDKLTGPQALQQICECLDLFKQWRRAVGTIIVSDSPLLRPEWQAERLEFNTLLASDYLDDDCVLVDLAANVFLASVCPEYFCSDRMHLTKAGNWEVANDLRLSILEAA